MKTDKTDKMKTKRDFLFKATSFVPISDFIQLETVYIEKAMQEYTDQAIAAYKLKLKEEIDLYESTGAPLLKEVIYSMIDNPSNWYDENNNLNA